MPYRNHTRPYPQSERTEHLTRPYNPEVGARWINSSCPKSELGWTEHRTQPYNPQGGRGRQSLRAPRLKLGRGEQTLRRAETLPGRTAPRLRVDEVDKLEDEPHIVLLRMGSCAADRRVDYGHTLISL